MIGEIPISDACHYMDAHDTKTVEEVGVSPPRMMYIIPSYHNPTGRSMTVEERKGLASFAIKNGVMLVADKVYHLLDWEEEDRIDGEKMTANDMDDAVTQHRRQPAGITHFDNSIGRHCDYYDEGRMDDGNRVDDLAESGGDGDIGCSTLTASSRDLSRSCKPRLIRTLCSSS